MSNTSPRIVHLKSLLALEEKRSALQDQLDDLLQQIAVIRGQLFDDAPVVPTAAVARKRGRPASVPKALVAPAAKKGRTQRGALKARILVALENAGGAGVRVTELADSLGTKPANLHAWFHATAKRMPNIVKIGGGHYRLNGHGPKATAPVKAEKVKAPVRGRKPGKAKRGALSEGIMGALTDAGSSGVTIKELSDKVGSSYRNVAVWFATTGKKNSKIKKMAPATYRLAA